MNFINDEGFVDFFKNVIFEGKSKINHLYVNENNLTEFKASELYNQLVSKKMTLFVDRFEKMLYTQDSKMEKTLYINLGAYQILNINNLVNARKTENLLREKRTGLIKAPPRVKFGRKIWNKTSAVNAYMFVEFEDILSIANVTTLNSRGHVLNGYKAHISGSNTFVHIRRSRKK